MTRGEIFGAILVERVKQDERWGGFEHDVTHQAFEWLGLMNEYAIKADDEIDLDTGEVKDGPTLKRRVIQVLALGFAMLESCELE